jgi:hypothetical protein
MAAPPPGLKVRRERCYADLVARVSVGGLRWLGRPALPVHDSDEIRATGSSVIPTGLGFEGGPIPRDARAALSFALGPVEQPADARVGDFPSGTL